MSNSERQEASNQMAEEIYQYLNEFYGVDIDIDDLKNIIDASIGSSLERLNEIE